MIIQFSETEQSCLTIQPVERRALSPAYLEEREQAWNGQFEKVTARGGQMWNGEVYTLEAVVPQPEERMLLRMSTCEYKDIAFRKLVGQGTIASRFGPDYLFPFTGVNVVPVTRDGKYVFGIRADRPEEIAPPISGIGGTLNKDEMEIHTFADIRQCMLREIQEETALVCAADDLRFFGLHSEFGIGVFSFTVRLAIDSAEINQYHRPGEFSSLLAITEADAFAWSGPMTGAFRRRRSYLHHLLNLLDA